MQNTKSKEPRAVSLMLIYGYLNVHSRMSVGMYSLTCMLTNPSAERNQTNVHVRSSFLPQGHAAQRDQE